MGNGAVTIKLDKDKLGAALRGAKAGAVDFSPMLKAFAARMKSDMIAGAFQSESDPVTGKSWKPSLRAKNEGGATLRDTGSMLQAYMAANIQTTKSTMELNPGAKVYSAIHQFGGTIRAKTSKGLFIPLNKQARRKQPGGRFARVQSVFIPARPFLGFSDKHKATFEKMVLLHLQRSAAK
jgi:phage gpG-like protein